MDQVGKVINLGVEEVFPVQQIEAVAYGRIVPEIRPIKGQQALVLDLPGLQWPHWSALCSGLRGRRDPKERSSA